MAITVDDVLEKEHRIVKSGGVISASPALTHSSRIYHRLNVVFTNPNGYNGHVGFYPGNFTLAAGKSI